MSRKTTTGMTLTELRNAHPDRFHDQNWYVKEAFMRILPEGEARRPPLLAARNIPGAKDKLPRAVDLAHAFLKNPEDPVFAYFLWCADKDALGQRIYVGGVSERNGYKLEIHRHLAIDTRWAVPFWP